MKFLLLFSMLSSSSFAFSQEPKLLAEQAVLMEFASGKILYEKNAYASMHPSSMTKIMTAYVAFDALKSKQISLDQVLPISLNAWKKGGSKMFIEVGKQIRVDDLLKGILVSSGNDACIALAEGISGDENRFAEVMMHYAHEFGLKNTRFVNSTGWPDEGHISSAYDIAEVSRHLIKNFPDEYKRYFSLSEFSFNNIKQMNRNTLLANNYADGLKTGHTELGGFGLASSAIRNDMRLIAVVNGLQKESDRISDSRILLDWGFSQFASQNVFQVHEPVLTLPLARAELPAVDLEVAENVSFLVRKGNYDKITVKLEVLKNEPPIAKGEVLAHMTLSSGDSLSEIPVPLIAKTDVKKASLFRRAQLFVTQFIDPPKLLDSEFHSGEFTKKIRNTFETSVKF